MFTKGPRLTLLYPSENKPGYTILGMATIMFADPESSEDPFQRVLYGHNLPYTRVKDHIVITNVKSLEPFKMYAYPFTLTTFHEVPATVGGMTDKDMYV